MSSHVNSDAPLKSSSPAIPQKASPLATLTVSGKQFEQVLYHTEVEYLDPFSVFTVLQ